MAENLAAEVVELYSEAERLMIARMARNLAEGIDGPRWAELKRTQMVAYRRQAEELLADLRAKAATGVRTAITDAYERGGLAAVADLNKLAMPTTEPLAGLRAIEALTAETLGNVVATHPRILRSAMDAYRDVVANASAQVLTGAQTRTQAAQSALDAFAKRGITGFIDKAGRGWNLDSYVEMAVRTGSGKAAVEGHVDRLTGNGIDLAIVSQAAGSCPLCAPWEGKVLSLTEGDSKHRSLAEARAAGLQHCGCRHSISAYQEGVTPTYKPPISEEDNAQRYKDSQKMRYIERQIRASKRMEAAAMDETTRHAARARVSAYQAKARAHVADTTAIRKSAREQIGKAH